MPRGIGLAVSGIVESIGDGVRTVAIGDAVLGRVNFTEYTVSSRLLARPSLMFALEDWRAALERSQRQKAHDKLMLLVNSGSASA